MTNGFSSFVKGVGTGMAVGMTIVAAKNMTMKNNKKVKRNAGRAMRAVGDLIQNVQYMMK